LTSIDEIWGFYLEGKVTMLEEKEQPNGRYTRNGGKRKSHHRNRSVDSQEREKGEAKQCHGQTVRTGLHGMEQSFRGGTNRLVQSSIASLKGPAWARIRMLEKREQKKNEGKK